MPWRSQGTNCASHTEAAPFSLPFLLLTLSPPTFSTAGRGRNRKENAHLAPAESGRGASSPCHPGRPAAIPDANGRLRSRGTAPHYRLGARNASRPHGGVRRGDHLRDPPRSGEVCHRPGRAAETPPPCPPPFPCPHLQQPPPPGGLLHRPPAAARGIHGGPGAPGTRQPSLPPSGPTRRAPPLAASPPSSASHGARRRHSPAAAALAPRPESPARRRPHRHLQGERGAASPHGATREPPRPPRWRTAPGTPEHWGKRQRALGKCADIPQAALGGVPQDKTRLCGDTVPSLPQAEHNTQLLQP